MRNLILALIFLPIISCQKNKTTNSFDYGSIEKGIYHNSYFKISIELPINWTILTGKDFTKFVESSAMENSDNKKELSEAIEVSKINRAELLALYKFPLDIDFFNPNIMIIAENIKLFQNQIKTGRDYLGHSRITLERLFPDIEITDGFEEQKIGGLDFWLMHSEQNTNHGKVEQLFNSTIINGFSFLIVLTYSNETEKEELNNILNNIEFKN